MGRALNRRWAFFHFLALRDGLVNLVGGGGGMSSEHLFFCCYNRSAIFFSGHVLCKFFL